jgi:hypothetical protein
MKFDEHPLNFWWNRQTVNNDFRKIRSKRHVRSKLEFGGFCSAMRKTTELLYNLRKGTRGSSQERRRICHDVKWSFSENRGEKLAVRQSAFILDPRGFHVNAVWAKLVFRHQKNLLWESNLGS